MLLKLSSAVTVRLKLFPAVTLLGAVLSVMCVAGPALTAIELLEPTSVLVEVSVAVRVWFPAILSVTLNMPIPAAKVLVGGKKVAVESELVSETVPVYLVAVLLKISSAMTVTVKPEPAVADEVALMTKCD